MLNQKYWILTYSEDGFRTHHTIEFDILHWAVFILYTRYSSGQIELRTNFPSGHYNEQNKHG